MKCPRPRNDLRKTLWGIRPNVSNVDSGGDLSLHLRLLPSHLRTVRHAASAADAVEIRERGYERIMDIHCPLGVANRLSWLQLRRTHRCHEWARGWESRVEDGSIYK